MSVKVMGLVWDLHIPSNEKLVLLAYADHADHDGRSIWPSVAKIAAKTSYSERSVQEITRSLQARGLLVHDGKGPRGTNKWRVGSAVVAPAETAPVQDDAGEGEVIARADLAPVQDEVGEGAIIAAGEFAPVQDASQKGADPTGVGVRSTAPESSLTVIEPSTREGLSQTEKDQALGRADLKSASPTPRHAGAGMPTTMIDNANKPTYPNRDKIPDQYLRYADTYNEISGQEPTKRVLKDWLTAFRDWASEGIRPEHVRQAYKESEGRFMVTQPRSLTNTAVAVKAKGKSATSTMRDEAIIQTKRLLAENDGHRARRTLPPPGLREKLHAQLQKQTVKPDV